MFTKCLRSTESSGSKRVFFATYKAKRAIQSEPKFRKLKILGGPDKFFELFCDHSSSQKPP